MKLRGHGAMLANGDGFVTLSAEPCPVVDTTGAGDTFMAVALAPRLCAKHASTAAPSRMTRAAAIMVGRPGTRSAFPSMQELTAILASS